MAINLIESAAACEKVGRLERDVCSSMPTTLHSHAIAAIRRGYFRLSHRTMRWESQENKVSESCTA